MDLIFTVIAKSVGRVFTSLTARVYIGFFFFANLGLSGARRRGENLFYFICLHILDKVKQFPTVSPTRLIDNPLEIPVPNIFSASVIIPIAPNNNLPS